MILLLFFYKYRGGGGRSSLKVKRSQFREYVSAKFNVLDSEPSLTATTHHNNSIQVYDSIPTSGHETSDSTGAPGGRGGAGNARSTASAATESAVEFLGRLTGANTHPNNAPRRPSLT